MGIGVLDILLIGIALSADAMSVTICNVLGNPHLSRDRRIAMPVMFGLFQGLMPVAGYFAGSLAATFIERYAGIIALVILGAIGGKMVWDGFHETCDIRQVSYKVLFLQAIATSIDAFAVGVTFVGGDVNVWIAAGIIALCTLVLCALMLAIGTRFGDKLGQHAQVVGGIILILIGVKAMFF